MPALPLLLALLATAPNRPDHSRVVVASHDAVLESDFSNALRQAGFTIVSGRPMVVGKPVSAAERAKQPIDTSRADVLVQTEAVSGQVLVVVTRVQSKQEVLRWASSPGPRLATEFVTKLREALQQSAGTFRVEARGVRDDAALQVLARMFEAAGAKVLTSQLGTGGRATLTAQYPGGTSTLLGPLLDGRGAAFKTMSSAFSAMDINEMSDDALTITMSPK